jgi:hypothetical protein
MPGYVHTCTSCGHQMLVAERYLGRELRCTSCRAQFTAALPPQETTPAVELPPAPARRWPALAIGCLGLVGLALALAVWIGRPSPDAIATGHQGVLGNSSQGSYYCALDRATARELAALQKRASADRQARLRQLLDSYRVIEVPSGTRLEVLVGGRPTDLVQVILQSSRWSGKKVWVTGSLVR